MVLYISNWLEFALGAFYFRISDSYTILTFLYLSTALGTLLHVGYIGLRLTCIFYLEHIVLVLCIYFYSCHWNSH